MSELGRRSFLGMMGKSIFGGAAAMAAPRFGEAAQSAGGKPNFVFILIDDMGWADVGCYGSTYYETPNIDRLATQGMRFTDAYAACPVCSPTRASILTGKYPARLNLTDFIAGKKAPHEKLLMPKFNQALPLEETTIAEALKPAGYTSACIGKWHLGKSAEFAPDKQGFDATTEGAKRDKDDPKSIYSLTRAAMAFMEENRDRPFFLYLSHHTVHLPIQAREDAIAKYERKRRPGQEQNNAQYAAMVEHTDDSVGMIMEKLDALGLSERTVLVFFSDNGGFCYERDGEQVTSNAPLRLGKGTLYEGGVREPLIVRWPGVVEAGSECTVPVTSVDFYPTLTEIARAAPDPSNAIDGVSLLPLLRQTGDLPRDAIFWHYPHYHHSTPAGSVRQGDYKLIEFHEDNRLELYNLREDIGEKTDLSSRQPEKARELRGVLDEWRKSVGAKMPTPNPDHDPERAGGFDVDKQTQ